MGTQHNLTFRTATAIGRLAELQRRAERADKPSPLVRSALQELAAVVEELQAANEALQSYAGEITSARQKAATAEKAREELANVVPLPLLWTDQTGVIAAGNESASQLLNIGKHHLPGKPLMLFVSDRALFFGALRSLCETAGVASIDVDITVRPRERRPRKMKLSGRRVESDSRCLWFLDELNSENETRE
jgi:hypothetical protein